MRTAYLITAIVLAVAVALISTQFLASPPPGAAQTAATQTAPPPTSTNAPTSARPGGCSYPIVVVDSVNRTVAIERPMKRLVAIGPGALRLVVYLNASDLVAGVEQFELRGVFGRDYAMALGSNWFKIRPWWAWEAPTSPSTPKLLCKRGPT